MSKKIESYQTHLQSGILLNANESSLNLDETIMNEIKEEIASVVFNRYPDNDQTEILEAYSKVIKVKKEQILAGNGSDQMLGLMIGTFLGKGKILYTFDPDFSMYDYYASSYEAEIKKFELQEDGTLDVDAFISEGKEANVSLILFSNPNNPTGNCLYESDIRRIVEAFSDIPVVVDEAYIEFANAASSVALIDQYKNLYVTRTLSKAYSLAGLRLGFLLSNEANMKELKAKAVPYALNSMTMRIGKIVLRHASIFLERAEETKKKRNAMYEDVSKLRHVTFYASEGNFLHGKCTEKQKLLEYFEAAGIVIRNYPNKDTFRITIGTEEENQKVLQVLKRFEEESQ